MKIEGSSNIDEVEYNETNKTLKIKFLKGGVYLYEAVPLRIYEALINADSVGSYFYANIRNKYRAKKLTPIKG